MSQIRVLIAEDESRLRSLIEKYLINAGFSVYAAENGEKALDFWYEAPVDLAILDITMPRMNGWEVLAQIRAESDIPIILLTAKREEIDRIHGFELGTDDYITKPFSPRELVMRVQALLKRSGKLSQKQLIQAADMVIDTASHDVQTSTGSVELSAREYDLLLYFLDNRGLLLSRTQLLERIWGYEYEGSPRVLDTTIKRLRQKLGGAGDNIKTLRGAGYRFEVHDEKDAL